MKAITEEKSFTPEEVRNILKADNTEVKRLCKRAAVLPHKDLKTGKAYFLKSDIDLLQKIKELNTNKSSSNTLANNIVKNDQINSLKLQVETLTNAFTEIKKNMVSDIKGVLEEKLDGIDDVIVELINSKTENEILKQKINDLKLENHKLSKELSSYKPLTLGLYVKSNTN